MKIETTRRPLTDSSIKLSKYSDLWTAVQQTAITGEAIRVSGLTFKEMRCIRTNFRYRLDGFRFKGVMQGKEFVCWLEPIPDEPQAGDAVGQSDETPHLSTRA
jgi:hypothetical protein